MTDEQMYDYIKSCFKFDISNKDGIELEHALDTCPSGWQEIIKKSYKFVNMVGATYSRLYFKRGRLRVEYLAHDRDTRKFMYYARHHPYGLSRRTCLVTGGVGIHQTFIEERPALAWEPRVVFANMYYEEHGYDGLYEPVKEAIPEEERYSVRGRYREGSPARFFHPWKTGKDDSSSEG